MLSGLLQRTLSAKVLCWRSNPVVSLQHSSDGRLMGILHLVLPLHRYKSADQSIGLITPTQENTHRLD